MIKFKRTIVVEAVAADATHCSSACPLWSPPCYCTGGIVLQFEEPAMNVRGRQYLRTESCKQEADPGRLANLDLRAGRVDEIRK
jgi:hypothetical protein